MTTKNLTKTALFAAMIAVMAQISIPIGPVPINFAHVGIFLSAGLLGAKYGTLSVLTYMLLGLVGIPVFSGLRGGLAVILGPTGGFIIGYLICSLLTGILGKNAVAMTIGLIANYLVGVPWLMTVTGMDFVTAMTVGVLPFLVGDSLKIIISAILVKRLQLHT